MFQDGYCTTNQQYLDMFGTQTGFSSRSLSADASRVGAFVFVALGTGAIKPNVMNFGADQCDTEEWANDWCLLMLMMLGQMGWKIIWMVLDVLTKMLRTIDYNIIWHLCDILVKQLTLVIINDVVGYMNQYAQPDDPEGFWLELHMTRKSPK